MDFEDYMSVSEEGVIISAAPTLVESDGGRNVFGYYFCIENLSQNRIKIVGKNWNIADDMGNRFTDDSVGFKGEIPELEPGEFFEFTSTASLDASNAVFYGSCKIASDRGVKEVQMPTFSFASRGRVSIN